jgi:hypothetical protein
MWRDESAVNIKENNFTLVAALAYNGYDSNYLITFWTTLIFTLLDAVLIGLSWGPFAKFY